MRSSGRRIASAALLLALVGGESISHAQTPAAVRYESLREQEVRVATSPAAEAADFRVVVDRYWAFVRQNPSNGYADNALWQAANLAKDAFDRFGDDRDKFRAIQLFQWLSDQYPHSSLVIQAKAQVEELAADQSISQAASTRPASQPSTSSRAVSTIRAVHRQSLPDVVRVTIEMDREVPFYQERLEGPARLFFDLKSTRTIPTLADAVFRYETDVIRHIRLGRHPGNTTRIVLDLEHVGRYSVFTLYNPYRIVIDSERDGSAPVPTLQAALAPLILGAQTETAGTRALPSRIPPPDAAGVRKTSPPPVPSAVAPTASSTAPRVESAASAPAAIGSTAPTTPSTPVPTSPAPTMPSTNSSGKYSVARQLGLGVSRIVIDAGHGGHDPGASASGLSEAELVLDVALRLEKLLLDQPGMEVILTRRSDDYLTLEDRTEIANRENADLFLSIHANASANSAAQGVETYFLNFALNPQAEAVAARENAASGRTMNSLPSIIKAITLNSKLNESRDFAGSIQRALVRGLRPGNKNVRDLGVKQAPFMVLIGAAMPSVLAEISFVTNPQEARLLKTPAYRQRVAESLLAGIARYQQSLKKVETSARK